MFRYLHYRSLYGSYLHNEQGIKKFAERVLGRLLRKVTKKSAFYREMNENLLVEKANLRLRADELYEQPMLRAGEFFSVRRQLWADSLIVFAIVVASILLNYFSIAAFILEGTEIAGVLRFIVSGVLAVVLTGGGLIVAERLIETLLPQYSSVQSEEDLRPVAPLWFALLIAIELALLGVATVRAGALAAEQNNVVLYYGYIVLAMILPILAGALRWDAMRHINVYKTTQVLRQIEGRLAQIDSILRQNEEYESNFYKVRSIASWDQLNEFRTYKDNYNLRKGYEESLSGHFAQTYDTFQAEANKRYEADIRDITAKSIRKLELVEKAGESRPGSKLGQGTPTPRLSKSDGSEAVEGQDIYLSPQPIR